MWPFSSYPSVEVEAAGIPVTTEKRSPSDVPSYDYIVVGGGTAGCCLAARLSEDPGVTVLLLERGAAADTWVNGVPLLSGDLFKKDSLARPSKALPLANADGRVLTILRGEALGGGSRVNAMIYTRGLPGDFNSWRDMGHPEWSYDKLLPYFIKSETSLTQPESHFRGKHGPWVNQNFLESPYPVANLAKKAAVSHGIPIITDFNSPDVPAVSCANLDIAIDGRMKRSSTFSAYIPNAVATARQDRLKICCGALTTRIIFEQGGRTPRAVGVEFSADDPAKKTIFRANAKREVILCSGALGSPQLLLLSGVGPRKHLEEHGIPVVHDSPAVGNYLKDHIDCPVMWHVPIDDSLFVLLKKPWRGALEFFKYILSFRSLLSHPYVSDAIFLPTRLLDDKLDLNIKDAGDLDARDPNNLPDIELKFLNVSAVDPGPDFVVTKGVFSFLCCLLRPKSTGYVRLKSSDPFERPLCELGMLTHPDDLAALKKGIRLGRKLGQKIQEQGYDMTEYAVPEDTDEAVEKHIRKYLRTTYHYTSTCRMATPADPQSGVVDDELNVIGVEGLRVCDASIFPDTLAAHTMAGIVAVAEKCADLIKNSYH